MHNAVIHGWKTVYKHEENVKFSALQFWNTSKCKSDTHERMKKKFHGISTYVQSCHKHSQTKKLIKLNYCI